jgi:hypothetical protein
MFDIKLVEAEARKEVADEKAKKAKTKIVAKLKEIEAAEKIVANLKQEYAVLLADIGNE